MPHAIETSGVQLDEIVAKNNVRLALGRASSGAPICPTGPMGPTKERDGLSALTFGGFAGARKAQVSFPNREIQRLWKGPHRKFAASRRLPILVEPSEFH